jgi:hypothetical protein
VEGDTDRVDAEGWRESPVSSVELSIEEADDHTETDDVKDSVGGGKTDGESVFENGSVYRKDRMLCLGVLLKRLWGSVRAEVR